MIGPRFLLDTNTCIYIRRNKPAEVLVRFKELNVGDAGMSAITFGELHYGAVKAQKVETAVANLRELASLIPVLALPRDAAEHYGDVRARLARQGLMIGSNDLWIAAHALASDLILVTNNEREFRRVDGLRVENWAAEP